MNPARTLGPAVAFGDLSHVWYYLLATFLGGLASGYLYRYALGAEDLEHGGGGGGEAAGGLQQRGQEAKRFA